MRSGAAGIWPSILLIPSLILLASGCDIPNYQGPQIQEPPTGFHLQPEAVKDREMFPEREIIHRTAWVSASWGEVSTIHITGYPGVIMRADVHDAQMAAQNAVNDSVTFGEVREVTIDERRSWGWSERLETPTTGIEWVAYRVVVPYDTITYAVELFSGDPTFKGVPDTLAAIAATFAVGETTWNIPVLVLIGIVLGILVRTYKKRADARAESMRRVHFVEIPKKDGEEEEGAEGEAEGEDLGDPQEPPGGGQSGPTRQS